MGQVECEENIETRYPVSRMPYALALYIWDTQAGQYFPTMAWALPSRLLRGWGGRTQFFRRRHIIVSPLSMKHRNAASRKATVVQIGWLLVKDRAGTLDKLGVAEQVWRLSVIMALA